MIPLLPETPDGNKATGSSLSNMFAISEAFLSKKKNNLNPIQVESQVPYWMKANSDGYGNHSLMIDFLNYYYEWLSEKYGYENTSVFDLSRLADINEAPEFVLPHFIKYYAPDIEKLYDLPNYLRPTDEQIRRTIENIRTELYQRKSTEICYKSILYSLFGIDGRSVNVLYPKRKIMRLNAGVLPWMSENIITEYGPTGEYGHNRYTLVGSYLNQGVLQDGNLWQEYSYVVQSELDDRNPYYETVIKETIHPAGMLGFFEKNEVYTEVSDDVTTYYDYEIPMVANYYPYTLGNFTSLPFCSGCTGSLFEIGWTFPTFVYPTWADEIQVAALNLPFGNIRVQSFINRLSTTATGGSPNDAIGTNCDYICGATGNAQFSWYVIKSSDSLRYDGLTGISRSDQIYFENESTFGFNRYLWQFGNGRTSANENPTFKYTTIGIFGVTLTAFKDVASYSNATGGVTFYVT